MDNSIPGNINPPKNLPFLRTSNVVAVPKSITILFFILLFKKNVLAAKLQLSINSISISLDFSKLTDCSIFGDNLSEFFQSGSCKNKVN